MINISDTGRAVLGGSFTYAVRVESWLGGVLLDDDVPVDSASEETDSSLRVPERVTLTIPATADGVSYAPVSDDAPLGTNGQRLRVQLGVGTLNGAVEWLQRGWFVIQDSTPNGDQVSVTAVGLLAMIDEARLVAPYQPTGTLGSTLRGLLEPALTVDLAGAPADRSVPASINFDDDRLAAVYEILEAWPATGYVNENGVFVVLPATQSLTPDVVLSTDATIVQAVGDSTRDGAYNVVVARGTATDGGQVQGAAYDVSAGPRRYGGPFNPLPVPYFYASPLLTTVAQCNAAARSTLARLQRNAGAALELECVPDPTLQVGDVVQAEAGQYGTVLAAVTSISLPYVPGAAMRLGIRVLS